jgi:hypothetical protein
MMPYHRVIGSQHFETTVMSQNATNWLSSDVVSYNTRRETQDSECDSAFWRKKCVYNLWLIISVIDDENWKLMWLNQCGKELMFLQIDEK